MSKSVGNVIEPEKIIKQSGAEILRLWSASVEYSDDVRLSDTILQRLTDAYRKLRNTLKYALGNLAGFDPAADALPFDELLDLDKWILLETRAVVADCLEYYSGFAFHRVYRRLYDFATTDLSAVYFDIIKDRLYTSVPHSRDRRSAQTALYRITDALLRLLAPVLSFTAEEAWSYLPKNAGEPASVHLATFPNPNDLAPEADRRTQPAIDRMNSVIRGVRDEVLKALETARQDRMIGSNLEAKVIFGAHPALEQLRAIQSELATLFIVSGVELRGEGEPVRVERADGEKCERCWKYTTDVGTQAAGICAECASEVPYFTA